MQGKKVGAFAESAEIRSVQIASPAVPNVWTCEDGHVFDIGPVALEVDIFAIVNGFRSARADSRTA